jgi:hypothetical protein
MTKREQREENLRQMRSPGSIALGVFALLTVLLACIFYDHPLMKSPHIVASLRHHITAR